MKKPEEVVMKRLISQRDGYRRNQTDFGFVVKMIFCGLFFTGAGLHVGHPLGYTADRLDLPRRIRSKLGYEIMFRLYHILRPSLSTIIGERERESEKMEVGFLRLGIMGKAMSMNLFKHGFKVTVWNRTLSKCDEFVEHGASVCETPAEVIKKCKYTIAMLSDPSAALSVVFDKGGVLEQICEGKGYIEMSTVDAETSLKINEAITGKGGRFVEGPVSGSKKPAEDGQLIILAAGDKRSLRNQSQLLTFWGRNRFSLGKLETELK